MKVLKLVISIPMFVFLIYFTVWSIRQYPLMLLLDLLFILILLCLWSGWVRDFFYNLFGKLTDN
jgi:hypothetical protein